MLLALQVLVDPVYDGQPLLLCAAVMAVGAALRAQSEHSRFHLLLALGVTLLLVAPV